MRFFKNPDGIVFGYDTDGHQDDLIKAAVDGGWEEAARPVDPRAIPEALVRMSELESSVTPRRLREAILGTDSGWLKALDQQIATLRTSVGSKP